MPSERARAHFEDILRAIDLISSWIENEADAPEAILDKPLFRSAIERQLLVISEAAIRLDRLDAALAPRLAPDVDWDTQIIADVLSRRLSPLRNAILDAVASLRGED
jgi:uncharacterized protein with HEPN domain